MRVYLLYILTGLITLWVLLFLFGLSAGFANYAPILAIVGSVLLFVVASPVLIWNERIGIIIGVISCLLLLPFDIGFTISLFDDGVFNWGTLLGFSPIVGTIMSLFYSIKAFRVNKLMSMNRGLRIFLFLMPILMFVLYVVFYGKYWSWGIFKI